MTVPLRERRRRTIADRAVRPVARLVSALVEPLWYWLGLLDPDGHPDNSKVVYTVAAVAAVVMVVIMGIRMVQNADPVTWPFVGLVAAVLLYAAGVRYLLKGLRMKLPGATGSEDEDTPPRRSGAAPAPPTPPGPGSGE